MPRFALIPVVLLILGAACSPKKQNSEAKSSGTILVLAPEPPPQNGSLLGSWSNCHAYPQGIILGVKSSQLTYEFKDSETMVMRASYFTDEDCLSKFTPAMAEDFLKELEKLNNTPVPADIRESVQELAAGLAQELPYAATRVDAGDVGALDFKSMTSPSYTSYRVWNDTLYIANVCLPGEADVEADTEACDARGSSPEQRATDFTDSDIFARQK